PSSFAQGRRSREKSRHWRCSNATTAHGSLRQCRPSRLTSKCVCPESKSWHSDDQIHLQRSRPLPSRADASLARGEPPGPLSEVPQGIEIIRKLPLPRLSPDGPEQSKGGRKCRA